MSGPGVAPLVIPEVSKAVNKYERAKEKRCQASPDEIAAKRALQAALHKHADELPKDSSGFRYYQQDDINYTLEETLKRKRAGGEDGGDEE